MSWVDFYFPFRSVNRDLVAKHFTSLNAADDFKLSENLILKKKTRFHFKTIRFLANILPQKIMFWCKRSFHANLISFHAFFTSLGY